MGWIQCTSADQYARMHGAVAVNTGIGAFNLCHAFVGRSVNIISKPKRSLNFFFFATNNIPAISNEES